MQRNTQVPVGKHNNRQHASSWGRHRCKTNANLAHYHYWTSRWWYDEHFNQLVQERLYQIQSTLECIEKRTSMSYVVIWHIHQQSGTWYGLLLEGVRLTKCWRVWDGLCSHRNRKQTRDVSVQDKFTWYCLLKRKISARKSLVGMRNHW